MVHLFDMLVLDPDLDHEDSIHQKRLLLSNIRRVGMEHGNRKRNIRIYGGMWIGNIREQIEDVLVTDSRLVEEPDCISGKDIPFDIVRRRAGDPASVVAVSNRANKVLDWSAKYSDLDTLIRTSWDIYK